MFEFLSSPFGLVAVGLGVLAVAVLALCLWITTLDRRMRGMADGLEAERRKVAEMQMVIGRRNNAARSYGRGGRPAPAAAPAPTAASVPNGAPAAMAQAAPVPSGAAATAPGASVPGRPAPASRSAAGHPSQPTPNPQQTPQGCGPQLAPARGGRPARGQGSRHPQIPRGAQAAPAPTPQPAAAGWTPTSIPLPTGQEVDSWVQGGPADQAIVMPGKKMSRKARREAERAFAARAAAELEARQARRAQEVSVPRGAQRTGNPRAVAARGVEARGAVRPYGGPAAPVPSAVAQAQVQARGRHAR